MHFVLFDIYLVPAYKILPIGGGFGGEASEELCLTYNFYKLILFLFHIDIIGNLNTIIYY